MKVSVIIPYKEDRGWLQQAIDSIPKDCEVILSQGYGNCQQNFNAGVKKATGDYIRWLHDDDKLTSNCIEDSLRTFEEQNCDFIHGNAYQCYEGFHQITNTGNIHGRIIPYIPPIKHPTLKTQLQKNVIHSMTTMYRREVFDKVGYMDETLQWSEETEFHLRCLHAGLRIGYCDAFLAYYRIHSGQKSNADHTERMKNREAIKSRFR